MGGTAEGVYYAFRPILWGFFALLMPDFLNTLSKCPIIQTLLRYDRVSVLVDHSDGGDTIFVMDQVGDKNGESDWMDEIR